MGRITLSFESGKTDDCADCKLYFLCKSKDDMMTQYGLDCSKYDFSKMGIFKEDSLMINNNELMLGNYVEICGEFHKIELLAENYVFCGPMESDYDEIKPIPITEDILERCGFERRVSNDTKEVYFKDGIAMILPIDESLHIYHLCLEDTFGYVKNIKYLHQLQNSYFILTGETLNIEL